MLSTGLLTHLEARTEAVSDLEAHLSADAPAMHHEEGTAAWFAFHFGRNDFGTVAVFADDASRRQHLAIDRHRDATDRPDALLAQPASTTKLDVFAHKLPAPAADVGPITKGLLLTFDARHDRDEEVQRFLIDAEQYAADEPGTTAWFAIGVEGGQYGIFDVFPDSSARRHHLTGHVPRELAKEAFSLLGGLPEMHFVDVVATSLTPEMSAHSI